MITLFVGDNDQSLCDRAKEYDPSAVLIDHSNWRKFLKHASSQDTITGYTSLSDLPKINEHGSILWELLKISDKIYYSPPIGVWSDHNGGFSWTSQKILTEFYLSQCQMIGKNVIGLNLENYKKSNYLDLKEKRINDSPSLWVSGCSISHGVGVTQDERYGTLIGKSLQRPTYHLTKPGSSLEWAADQILRSDIRQEDLVIWGLTQEKRAPLARNSDMIPWPDDTIDDVEYRMHETRYYKAITSVFQVINFCNKIQCQLILLPLICSEKLRMDLVHQESYHNLPYDIRFIDIGSDNIHPGPKQHQFWADFCLDIINGKSGAW